MAKKRKAKKAANRKPDNPNLPAIICRVTHASHSFLSRNDLTLLPSQTLLLETLISFISHSHSHSHSHSLPPPPLPPPQPDSWFHRFRSVSDTRWLDAFRMSKPSFSHLLNLLSPSLSPSFPHTAPDTVLAAALFRLAHAAPYAAISRRFGLSTPDASRAFFAVCKALTHTLAHLFELRTDPSRVVVGFGFNSLPNCFGALGFSKFKIEGENVCLMVQALVDSEGRFLDVSAGWPSTMKPEVILRQSKLYAGVEESKELLNGASYNLGDSCLIPQYILGDSCFPLLPWLLTPYNRVNEVDSFGSAERAFNNAHANAMGLVGNAFGRLRATWRILGAKRKWKKECVEYLPFVIVAGCLLHNFVVKCNEGIKDEVVVEKEEGLPAFDGVGDESGVRVRDALALHLSKMNLRR